MISRSRYRLWGTMYPKRLIKSRTTNYLVEVIIIARHCVDSYTVHTCPITSFAKSEHYSSYFVCILPPWISYSSSKKMTAQKFQFLIFNFSFPFSKSSCVLALRFSLAMFCAFSTKLDALVEELPEAGCPGFCVQEEITSYESALVRCLVASLS
jgi:hypothetical protein